MQQKQNRDNIMLKHICKLMDPLRIPYFRKYDMIYQSYNNDIDEKPG